MGLALWRVFCVHVNQWHPPRSIPVGLHLYGLLQPLPKPPPGLLALSAPLLNPQPLTLCSDGVCAATLPVTSLALIIKSCPLVTGLRLPARRQSKPFSAFNVPSNSLFELSLHLLFASHLYFSKSGFCSHRIYWVNSSEGHEVISNCLQYLSIFSFF